MDVLDRIPTRESDARLRPFLDAGTEKEAAQCLDRLLNSTVRPIVGGVLRHKLGVLLSQPGNSKGRQSQLEADAAELFQDALVQVTSELYRVRLDRSVLPIANLAHYTAAVAYQVVNLYFRKLYPRRASLTNKLRYLLNCRPEFSRWQTDDGEWLAGYARWQAQTWEVPEWNCHNGAARFPLESALCTEGTLAPAQLVARIFDWLGQPIRFEDLVTIIADLWGVRDLPAEPLPEDDTREALPATPEAMDIQVTLRTYWTALCALPSNQRCCLLLQASDPSGNSLIHIFYTCGIASLMEIAAAVVMPVEAVASIYPELPWDDKTIAGKLDTTPLYVTRLRGIARRKLRKAMQSEEETKSDD